MGAEGRHEVPNSSKRRFSIGKDSAPLAICGAYPNFLSVSEDISSTRCVIARGNDLRHLLMRVWSISKA